MYYQKFINFLKKHNLYNEEIIKYWQENSDSFDYNEEDFRPFIGCYYLLKNDHLVKIHLIVPFIDNDQTILINIHEYIHLFLLYSKLGKKIKIDDSKEVLPILFERIFIKENNTKELKNYYNYLKSMINIQNKKEYVIAIKISDYLIKKYKNNNLFQLEKKAKKMVKKKNTKLL